MVDWDRLTRRLTTDGNVVAFTGAGLSAESGLDTFRGEGGVWDRRDPSEVATPGAFRRDPDRVWQFYQKRRRSVRGAEPSAAHRILADWENRYGTPRVVTQNVDDLHERAGQNRVLHVHGRLMVDRCVDCGERSTGRLQPRLPTCSGCGGRLRPDVVWFGEPLDVDVLERARRWLRDADLLLVVGTSLRVSPVSEFPAFASQNGARVVEVNPEPGQHDWNRVMDDVFKGEAGKFFERWAVHVGED